MNDNAIETAILIVSCVLLMVFLIAAIGCGVYELFKTL